MNEPIIDREWRALASKAKTLIPNDEEENRAMLEDYLESGESPKGCSITNGASGSQQWACKMYLGGKQRVLGYGTCYQCARLYDAAYWRFKQYRINRDMCGTMEYNFGEGSAGDSNLDANIISLLSEMEDLLKSRGLLKTAEQREAEQRERKAEYQSNRYTAKGRIEALVEKLFEAIGAQSLLIAKLETRIDELAKRLTVNPEWITPNNNYRPINVGPEPMHIIPGVINPGPGYIAPSVTCKSAPFSDIVCKHPDSVQ